MENNPHISVVIPVYGCRGALYELYKRLVKTLESINPSFEIIMVNDACPQNSWEVIKELATKDERLRGINMSRNFGQMKAITAGIDYASGDWVVVMDCDLQDPPEEIIRLYQKAVEEEYDVVFARRIARKDTHIKKVTSKIFYKFYDYFTESTSVGDISNFSISNRQVMNGYRTIREQNRAFTLFIQWMGFKQTVIDVKHDQRAEGDSSYNFKKRWALAKDIIIAQSNKPLKFSVTVGILVSLLSFIYAIYLIVRYYVAGITVTGWTSLIVSIFFMSGLILMNIGIVGLYLGKTFDETKNRPIYLVKEVI
jgi:glycosyltransferase involved in cell wall biosynthesis